MREFPRPARNGGDRDATGLSIDQLPREARGGGPLLALYLPESR